MGDETGTQEIDERSSTRGLRDGFAAYEIVQNREYADLFDTGMIVFDTNSLLNLYRYTPQARADFIAAMHAVRDRILIPHQVATEFWRNRESAIADFDRATRQATEAFWKSYGSQITALNTWANRVSLSSLQREKLEHTLKRAVEDVAKEMDQLRDMDHTAAADTTTDPVLANLDSLLLGRVGRPLPPDSHAEAVKEGLRRVAENLPPGYADAKKPSDRQVGDFLVWEQVLTQAEAKSGDLLIVTGDVKPDWWRIDEKKNPKGPRPELFEEAMLRTKKKLRMLVPQEFLGKVREIYSIHVQPESLTNVAKVNVSRSRNTLLPSQLTHLQEFFPAHLKRDYEVFLGKWMDLSASWAPSEHHYDLHAWNSDGNQNFLISFISEDYADQEVILEKMREMNTIIRQNERVVLTFPSKPDSAVLDAVTGRGGAAVWRTSTGWLGTPGAAEAGLAYPF